MWAISDETTSQLQEEGIAGYRLHPLSFDELPRRQRPPFRYWVIEPIKMLRYELMFDGEIVSKRCPECGSKIQGKNGLEHLLKYSKRYLESDDNEEAWVIECEVDSPFWGFAKCSERILDIARTHHWSGAYFSQFFSLRTIVLDHYASNWRELRDYDIEIERAESQLIDLGPDWYETLRRKLREMKREGIPLLPHPRPEPIYDSGYLPPQPPHAPHPFDNLEDFDGCGWQGPETLSCGLVCESGDLFVLADEKSSALKKWEESGDDTIRPSKKTREAFDFIVANEKQVLPEVQRIVREQLQRLRPNLVLPNPETGMVALRDYLFANGGDLTLWDPVKRGRGDAQLGFTLLGDPPRDGFSIWLHFDLMAGTLVVKEVEGE